MEERDLQIHTIKAHQVNIEESTILPLDPPADRADFDRFIKSVLNEVSTSSVGRKYIARSNNTEVINVILRIIVGAGGNLEDSIASRLLREEINAQEQIRRLGRDIPNGLLIQSHIVDRGVTKFLICKAEKIDFIEAAALRRTNGYPIKRKIYRSVQIVFDNQNNIAEILVNDSSNRIATYWWDSFLEIDPHWDDAYNTSKAFSMIESKVLNSIKKESSADHTYIRNATIKYFRTTGEFELESYIENCIGDYQPVSTKINIDEIKSKIRELPEKWDFDNRFNLHPPSITARMVKSVVSLDEDLDLVIKNDINFEGKIEAIEKNHRKYLLIRTDKGYEAFKKA